MIISIFIYILAIVLLVMSRILPTWQPWPAPIHDAMFWFVDHLTILGIITDVPACLDAVGWFIDALAAYLFARLIISIINWFRGTSGIEV
jgi:hypothetical protein